MHPNRTKSRRRCNWSHHKASAFSSFGDKFSGDLQFEVVQEVVHRVYFGEEAK
jgi:hypothetical protein